MAPLQDAQSLSNAIQGWRPDTFGTYPWLISATAPRLIVPSGRDLYCLDGVFLHLKDIRNT